MSLNKPRPLINTGVNSQSKRNPRGKGIEKVEREDNARPPKPTPQGQGTFLLPDQKAKVVDPEVQKEVRNVTKPSGQEKNSAASELAQVFRNQGVGVLKPNKAAVDETSQKIMPETDRQTAVKIFMQNEQKKIDDAVKKSNSPGGVAVGVSLTKVTDSLKENLTPKLSPAFVLPKVKDGTKFLDLEKISKTSGRASIDAYTDLNTALQEASVTPDRAEIVAKIPLYQLSSGQGAFELNELRNTEKNLIIEGLDSDIALLSKKALPEIINDMIDSGTRNYADVQQKLEFMSTLRIAMDAAIDMLDIKRNSAEHTAFAKNFSQNYLEPLEQDFENFPDDIETFIQDYCSLEHGTPKKFSNTKIIHTIIREVANSIRRHHPRLVTNNLNIRNDSDALRFPEYLPEGIQSHRIDTRTLGTRYRLTPSQPTAANISAGLYSQPVTEKFYSALPGLKDVASRADRIKILCTVMHNELIVSAGLGKLIGTRLGNRFGGLSVDPIERVFGGYFRNESSVLAGAGAAMSYSDMIVLNERPVNLPGKGTAVSVLPFERTVVQDATGKEYLPGSNYFVENPIRHNIPTSPLASFSEQFSKLDLEAQEFLSTLLHFGDECPVKPSDILVLCLRAVRDMASFMAADPVLSAAPKYITIPLAFMARSEGFSFLSGDGRGIIDNLFTVCALHRRSIDKSTQDTSYIPTKSHARFTFGSAVNSLEEDKLAEINASPGERQEPYEDVVVANRLTKYAREIIKVGWTKSIPKLWATSPGREFSYDDFIDTNLYAPSEQKTASGETDIFDEIVKITRLLQKDSLALCRRNNESASFLDGDRFTNYNRWDDNTFLACVFEIVRILVGNLLLVDVDKRINLSEPSINKFAVSWNPDEMRRARDFLTLLIETYSANTPVGSIFDIEGTVLEGVNRNTKFGRESAGALSAGNIVDMLESLIDHRKFIKLGMGYLSSFTKNILDASKKVSETIGSTSESGNATKSFVFFNELHSDFTGKKAMAFLTREQLSLKQFALRSSMPIDRPCSLHKNFINSPVEDEIQRMFIEQVTNESRGDEIALCVGLPSGLIERLRNPKFVEEPVASREANLLKSVNNTASKFKIGLHRVNELFPTIKYSPIAVEFDSELFIEPGDMSFEYDVLLGDYVKTFDSVIRGSTFKRIRSGVILESKKGSEILSDSNTDSQTYKILKNHVIDRIFKNFSRDVIGVPLEETCWPIESAFGPNIIDNETFFNLQRLALSEVTGPIVGITSEKLSLIFEEENQERLPGFRSLRPASILNSLVALNRLSVGDITRVTRLLSSSLMNSKTETKRILCPGFFDRHLVLLLSNSFAQNSTNKIFSHFGLSEINETPENAESIKLIQNSFDINGYMCKIELV